MDDLPFVVIGAACGLLGCVPPAALLAGVLKSGTRVQVARGIASIIVSFGFMSVALAAVRLGWRNEVFAFGVAMMFAFVLFWSIGAVRIWLGTRAGRDSEGRN